MVEPAPRTRDLEKVVIASTVGFMSGRVIATAPVTIAPLATQTTGGVSIAGAF